MDPLSTLECVKTECSDDEKKNLANLTSTTTTDQKMSTNNTRRRSFRNMQSTVNLSTSLERRNANHLAISRNKVRQKYYSIAPYRKKPSYSYYKPPSKLPKNVVPEEEYVAGLTHIIQRDYFPDLHQLKKTREISSSSSYETSCFLDPTNLLSILPSPRAARHGGNQTPLSHYDNSSVLGDTTNDSGRFSKSRYVKNMYGKVVRLRFDMSLTKYLATYSSEDNTEFHKVLKKDMRKKGKEHQWMFKTQTEHNEKQLTLLNSNLKEGLDCGEKDLNDNNIQTNFYEARNSLFFYPPQFDPEKTTITKTGTVAILDKNRETVNTKEPIPSRVLEIAVGSKLGNEFPVPRRIFPSNCRVDPKKMAKMDFKASRITTTRVASRNQAFRDERALEQQVSEGIFQNKNSINATNIHQYGPEPNLNYTYLSAPVIIAGEGPDQSPIMTWGHLSNLPLLIEDESGSLSSRDIISNMGSTSEYQFSLPDEQRRDQLACDALKKQHAKRRMVSSGKITPSNRSKVRELYQTSEFARRLIVQKKAMDKGGDYDRQLRKAYKPRSIRSVRSSRAGTPFSQSNGL